MTSSPNLLGIGSTGTRPEIEARQAVVPYETGLESSKVSVPAEMCSVEYCQLVVVVPLIVGNLLPYIALSVKEEYIGCTVPNRGFKPVDCLISSRIYLFYCCKR